MTGNRLKEILYEKKVSQSRIAKLLGVSQQSFNQMLAAADIKSSLLERIAEALGEDMSLFYPIEKNSTNAVATGNGNVVGNNNAVGNVTIGDNAALYEKIMYLEQQVKDKESLLDEKERTIKILMSK